MENKLIPFYDMDNTLLEMSKYLVGTYSGYAKSYGPLNGINLEELLEKLHEEGLFTQFHPIRNSQKVLKKLVKTGYPVGIISQPMINDYCIKEKNFTLKKYFPFLDLKRVTYTFDKYLLAGTGRVLIDDNIEHLINWEIMGGISVCFVRGYNKDWQGLKIKDHYEIFELLEKLKKEVN